MNNGPTGYTPEDIKKAFQKNSGNISATAREMGISRRVIVYHLRKLGLYNKPLVGGGKGTAEVKANLPAKGLIKRYIISSAQNNTKVEPQFWANLLALSAYYEAEILIGTFSYNTNAYSAHPAKSGSRQEKGQLWFDPAIAPFIKDERIELANGLVWCGEMNILPTAVDPLSGLETYSHRKSAIFPHAKLAMRSIPTMQGEGTKLNYTTGCVTLRNYIQKKEGLKAEHHHRFAALVVEVNSDGNWWVRQVGYSSKDQTVRDLNITVYDGQIVDEDSTVEAITWGDLHATIVEEWVVEQSQEILDVLGPKVQFLHDILEGVSINRHQLKDKNPHYAYHRWKRGYNQLKHELEATVKVMEKYQRPDCLLVVPDSNHDSWWLKNWLAKFDYRLDPSNAELFLQLQTYMYGCLADGKMPRDVNITEKTMRMFGIGPAVKFLLADESFTICGGKIECGMHGHLGPNGSQASPVALSKIGRRANTAHTHSAGIFNGLYVAGTSSKLKWDYNYGPSSWSHSHIITYPNGQRAIVTMYAGRWRAE